MPQMPQDGYLLKKNRRGRAQLRHFTLYSSPTVGLTLMSLDYKKIARSRRVRGSIVLDGRSIVVVQPCARRDGPMIARSKPGRRDIRAPSLDEASTGGWQVDAVDGGDEDVDGDDTEGAAMSGMLKQKLKRQQPEATSSVSRDDIVAAALKTDREILEQKAGPLSAPRPSARDRGGRGDALLRHKKTRLPRHKRWSSSLEVFKKVLRPCSGEAREDFMKLSAANGNDDVRIYPFDVHDRAGRRFQLAAHSAKALDT